MRANGVQEQAIVSRAQSTDSAGKENRPKWSSQIPMPLLGVAATVIGAVAYEMMRFRRKTFDDSNENNEEEIPPSTKRDDRLDDIRNSAVKNLSLDAQLHDAVDVAQRLTLEASHGLKVAAEKGDDYSTKLMCALGESICGDDHHLSSAANDAKAIQSSTLQMAEAKRAEADKALSRLQEIIRRGRLNPTTVDNAHLDEAERSLIALQLKIDSASAITAKSLEKLNLTQKFGAAIEEGKKQLMLEVNAILPEGKSFAEPRTLTTEDLATLVSDTHRKIEAISRQLSQMQLGESEIPKKGNGSHKQESVTATKQSNGRSSPKQ